MKNRLFSVGLYAEAMRKLRVCGFIFMAVSLLCEISPALSAYMEYSQHVYSNNSSVVCDFYDMCYMIPVIAIAGTFIFMLVLFSGFNKRAYSDFYHALPYTRLCILMSNVAAVMTWTVGLSVFSGAAGILSRLAVPYHYISFIGFGTQCLDYFIISLFICSAVLIAVSLTGTLLSNVTVSGLIMFFPRFFVLVISNQVENNVSVLPDGFLPILSPSYNILTGVVMSVLGFDGSDVWGIVGTVGPMIYTFLVSVAYFALGAFLFTKRKSEVAGLSAPGKKTQAVIRIVLTMVPASVGTVLLMDCEIAGAIILWAVSLIVYFAYELLSTFKWKNLLRAIPTVIAVVVLNVVLVLAVVCISEVVYSYTPTAEEVTSVRFVESSGTDGYYIINRTSKISVSDKDVIKAVTDVLQKAVDSRGMYAYSNNSFNGNSRSIRCTVAIKEGFITRYRELWFTDKEYSEMITHLKNVPEFKETMMTLPEPIWSTIFANDGSCISNEAWQEIFKTWQDEINENGFEIWCSAILLSDEDTDGETTDGETTDGEATGIYYTVNEKDHSYFYIKLPEKYYPKTYKAMLEKSWEEARSSESMETLTKMIGGEYESFYFGIEGYVTDRTGEEAEKYQFSYYEDINIDGDESCSDTSQWMSTSKALESVAKLLTAALEDENSTPDPDRNLRIYVNASHSNDEEGKEIWTDISLSFAMPIPEGLDYEAMGFVQEPYYEG